MVSGRHQESIRTVSGRGLEGVQNLPGRCLEGTPVRSGQVRSIKNRSSQNMSNWPGQVMSGEVKLEQDMTKKFVWTQNLFGTNIFILTLIVL